MRGAHSTPSPPSRLGISTSGPALPWMAQVVAGQGLARPFIPRGCGDG